ncbi:toxin glutamine deamidase domain-containing protein, partial [Streptomyces sp. NRRL WC-3703]
QPPVPQNPNRPSIQHVRASLNHEPSGLYSPYPHDQQALLNVFPRNPDGTPRAFNDPFQSWAQYQNDGGPTVLGRSNNCADCTRSFIESWYGNPQVSAVRTYDPDGKGGIDRASGERDGTRNIEQWAGTQFRNSGPNSHDAYSNIADELRQAGHGAAAAVLVTWPKNPDGSGGGAHVFNAVNHNGRVIWVDSQTGEISQQPINTAADGVWHLTLDANRNPYDPTKAQTQTPQQQHPHTQPQPQPHPQNQQHPQHQPQHQHHPQPQPQPQPQPHNPYQQQNPYAQPQPNPYQQSHQPSPYQQPHQPGPYQQQAPYAQPHQPNPYQQQAPYAQPHHQPAPQHQPNPYSQQQPPHQYPGAPSPDGPGHEEHGENNQNHPDTRADAPNQSDTAPHPHDVPGSHDAPHGNDTPDHDHPPTPTSETRNRERPGGLDGPSDEHQQRVADAIPRDENGNPEHHPDPNNGDWVNRINEPGSDAPGRNNNCVDAALATADTYSGNPTAAAHRTPDLNSDGTPSDRGERNGRDRIENTLGARFNDYGNGRDAFNRLENTLRQAGHGSQAVIITQDRHGRAHAWNAVNHQGKITYVDSQTGRRSDQPLHSGDHGVHAVPLGRDRRPVAEKGHPPQADAGGARRPAAEPAGKSPPEQPGGGQENPAPKKPKKRTAAETRNALQQPLDHQAAEGTPGYGQEQGPDHTAQGMLGDEAQQRFRKTHVVRQVNWDTVLGNLNHWADRDAHGDSPLGAVMDHLREKGRVDEADLEHLLGDRYTKLGRDDRLATVSCLARLSYNYHAQHTRIDGHDINPEGLQHHRDHKPSEGNLSDARGRAIEYVAQQNVPVPDEMTPQSARQYRKDLRAERTRIKNLLESKQGDPAALPDFSGRNYAVFEVTETVGDTERVHFIVGSSVPAGEGVPNPDHSEPAAGEGLRQLDPKTFRRTAMFTEFEPCGNSGDLGGAACAHYLSENLDRPAGAPRVPHGEMKKQGLLVDPEKKSELEVSYGTNYRYGPFAVGETTKEAQDAVKQGWKDDMDRVRGELLRIWIKVHE